MTPTTLGLVLVFGVLCCSAAYGNPAKLDTSLRAAVESATSATSPEKGIPPRIIQTIRPPNGLWALGTYTGGNILNVGALEDWVATADKIWLQPLRNAC